MKQQNHVFINEQDIVECSTHGDQTDETVKLMGIEISALLEELRAQGKPRLLLDNIVDIGDVTKEGRHEVVLLAKTLDYDRAAMLGQKNIIQFGANLIIRASGRGQHLKFFSDREEAIAWLHEYRPSSE